MQQRGGWCSVISANVISAMVPVPALAPWRAQRGRLASAAAGAQAVQHAARVLLAVGAISSALPAAKALLTTLAKLLAAPCAPSGFRAELEVRRRGAGGRRGPAQRAACTHSISMRQRSGRLPMTTCCAGPAGRLIRCRSAPVTPNHLPVAQRRRPAGGAAAVRGSAAAAPAAPVARARAHDGDLRPRSSCRHQLGVGNS
jgi:hypothetical protein